MNILYLAHRIPFPPDKGEKLRAFRQLEHLARRHQVWCACFVDTPSDEQHIEPLRALCQEVAAARLNRVRASLRGVLGLASGRTVTESFYAHAVMGDTVRRWAKSVVFDAVVAFSSSMAPYALQVPAGRRVLDLCDLDSRKWLDYAERSRPVARWLYAAEGRRLSARERAWIGIFDATLLITNAEADALGALVPRGKVHIVGNGVSLPDRRSGAFVNGRLDTSEDTGRSDIAAQDSPGPPTVGFVGVMDYRPNIDAVTWFVHDCWPRIRAACPGAAFRIIGRSPTRRVRRLASTAGVEVVGGVDDCAAQVRKLHVSVAPMRIARGLQNKVLEAMAAAKPVVLTQRAADGIGGRDEEEFLVADTEQDIVQKVIRLLNDREECERIGRAARRFVAANHCWEGELQKFELIVTGVLGPKTLPLETAPAVMARQAADELNAGYSRQGARVNT